MRQNLIYLAIIIVLLVAGYYMLKANRGLQAPVQEGAAAAGEAGGQDAAPQTHHFSWRFVSQDPAEDGLAPRTDVALIADGEIYDLGSYPGSCAEIPAENLLPEEINAVLCWWAGAGEELGIFKRADGTYALQHGFQEEPTAESEAFRGDFQEILVIP